MPTWTNSMHKKKSLTFILFMGLLFGGSPKIHPMVKSAILPGWGEASMQNSKRARIFRLTEITMLTACISSYTFSGIKAKNYESYAVEHAGINSMGKDHKYWVDMGNYSSMDDHNDEHLRFRDIDDLYPENEGWDWTWDSDKNKTTFESMRIGSDKLALRGKFFIGGLIVNHIVSAIDALYLTRLEKINSISMIPIIERDGSYSVSLKIGLDL